ncbi:MAG: hypothetical protein KAJ18_05440 [Candidatus Omnitrophica bacterium]|nr:hypothetical protein [Candidatus Omnitrophota bacterium]
MNSLIIFIVLGILVAIIFLSRGASDLQSKRKEYLEGIARIFEAELKEIEGAENSFHIEFKYKDVDFVYEDLEDKGVEDNVVYRGFLKAKLPINLTLSFTEKSRGKIRAKMDTLSDLSSPWTEEGQHIIVPKVLEKFSVYTNMAQKANDLLADEQVFKELARYQSVDSRGHPVMSWDIRGGVISLRFHFGSGLKPSLMELHGDVGVIEDYVQRLLIIINKIKILAEKDN